MSFQFRLEYIFIVAICVAVILSGCQAQQAVPTATVEPAQVTPYWTATPSPTATPRQPADPATETSIPATIPPPPTPTPFIYVIEKGDTMGVIAYRFGVTVADLKAANPEVDPNLMSVGTELVIPILEKNEDGTPEALATATPVPIEIGQPDCYPVASGGAWCLALVHNDQNQALENLVTWMQLVSPDGEVLAGQQAVPPLNLLPAGQYLPVMAFFPDVSARDINPQIDLLSALPIPPGDRRYLPVDLQVEQTEIGPDGLHASVSGNLTLLAFPAPTTTNENPDERSPTDTPAPTVDATAAQSDHASQVWLAVTAYGADHKPVGLRKRELATDLAPGESLPFELSVFSLGPQIISVEVLVEVHP